MLSNSQTVTVGGTAHTLERTSMGDKTGAFEKKAAGLRLSVRNSSGKRNSVVVRLDKDIVGPDVFLTGVSKPYSMSVSLVINTPAVGISASDIEAAAQGLVDLVDTPGLLTKIVNGEA